MIYLVPIVFAATAAVLARPLASVPALAVGFAVALFLVLRAELRLDQYPYFEAPSLAIGHLANRNFFWDGADVERALVVAAVRVGRDPGGSDARPLAQRSGSGSPSWRPAA